MSCELVLLSGPPLRPARVRRERVSGPGLHTGPADAEADLPSTLPDYTDGEWQKFMRERQADIDEYVKEKMTEVRMAPEYAGPADAEADLPSTLPDYTDGEWQKFMRERQADIDEYVKEKMTEVRMAPEYAGPADAEADLPSTLPDYTDGEWQKFCGNGRLTLTNM